MKVCCRVDVRDRTSVWTAVTDDFCARGCSLVTSRLPRIGATLELTLWSDLFPDPLHVVGTAAWVSDRRIGVTFVAGAPRGRITPAEWGALLVEHGRVFGPEPVGAEAPRVVPVVLRRATPVRDQTTAVHDGRHRPDGDVIVLPVRRG